MNVFAAVAGVLCLAVSVFIWHWYRHRNLPPGPRGLPFVGYAPFLGSNPQDALLKLGKKYGNIFSLYLGPRLTIVLNDYSSLCAAYKGQADIFSGRTNDFVFRYLAEEADGESHGISFHDGEIHKTSRKFAFQAFRDLGKSVLQDKILEEIGHLISIFSKHRTEMFDPLPVITVSCSNVACIMSFGRRFSHNDPEFREFLRGTELNAQVLAQANPLQAAYPGVRFLPNWSFPLWKNINEATRLSKQFIHSKVKEHKSQHSYEDAHTLDYTDVFLHQQQRRKTDPDPIFKDEELYQNIRGFLQGGTGTTAVTLQWVLLYMLHRPDIQERIHRTLDDHIDRCKLVRFEDKAKLPFVEAVIWEVQRLANVTPFGLFRTNLKETVLMGYRIPKRTYVMPNFLAVNMDSQLWEDPVTFKAERFLDSEGKLFQPPQFMPFSIGRRSCVGEGLAKMELFLIFANIMHRFTLRQAEGALPPPTDQYTTDGLCHPLPFHIQAIPRI